MAWAARPTVLALLLTAAEGAKAWEAFLADDECLAETESECALRAMQFRAIREFSVMSNVTSIAQADFSNNMAPNAAPGVVNGSAANDTFSVPRDPMVSANSSSHYRKPSKVFLPPATADAAASAPGSAVASADSFSNRTMAKKEVEPLATPDAAASASSSSDSAPASREAELPATVEATDSAEDNSSSTDEPQVTEDSTDSADNSSGTTVTTTTVTTTSTGIPKPCKSCAVYDPSTHGDDWTPIPGQCYNLASALAAIENGSWCCENDIAPNMSAYPDECFVPPNHGGFPCFTAEMGHC